MQLSRNRQAESRQTLRLKLPAMYTLVRVRPAGSSRYRWSGHIYDISTTGMRFELDHALEPGTEVDIRAMLPGCGHPTVTATGRVVRIHDDPDEPGPIRMGMVFERFAQSASRLRLSDYLAQATRQAA